jgi:hypothetical protein
MRPSRARSIRYPLRQEENSWGAFEATDGHSRNPVPESRLKLEN